jgi:hypothetical protein
MRTLFTHVLITPRNFQRIRAGIVPLDQREAIRPGIIISHYAVTTQKGQHGYVITSPTTHRAGICFDDGPTEWGTWDEEAGTITTDGGRRYNRVGETMFEVGDEYPSQSEAPH